MCIISGPVNSVDATKILAIPSSNGKRQLTVYRNAVSTPATNLMILPCPTPNTVEFEYVPKDIFKQCENSFTENYTLSSRGVHKGMLSGNRSAPLPIQSHGSYDVVLVPNMNALYNVPQEFAFLTPEVISFLKSSYAPTFGFVLCKLKAGMTDYEPFAYSHDIQLNGQLFFPTKHYHVHSHVSEFNTDTSFYAKAFASVQYSDDWDHALYSIGTSLSAHTARRKEPKSNNEIDWSKMPSNFRLGPNNTMHWRDIYGSYDNVDIEMPLVAF
jgi:hypothetical protein